MPSTSSCSVPSTTCVNTAPLPPARRLHDAGTFVLVEQGKDRWQRQQFDVRVKTFLLLLPLNILGLRALELWVPQLLRDGSDDYLLLGMNSLRYFLIPSSTRSFVLHRGPFC